MGADIRQEITNDIIKAIEEGGLPPWRKTWATGGPAWNGSSGRQYHGVNQLLLSMQPYADPRWWTFKQAEYCGFKVKKYEASDQRRYFVPCPHCDHRQWLRFEQLRWDKGAPETAVYICESCEAPIAEHHKTWMLEQGEWRSMVPDSPGKAKTKTAGFHLSSLYSPVGSDTRQKRPGGGEKLLPVGPLIV